MPKWAKITLPIAIIGVAMVLAGSLACSSDNEADVEELCASWRTLKRTGLLQGFSEREIEAQFATEMIAREGITFGEAQARVAGINAVCEELER